MIQAAMSGARLAYVVVPLQGEVTRNITRWDNERGLHEEQVKQPAGFLVYFPRGHVLRLTAKELRRYKLDRKPKLTVDMSQMYDPESPVGKIFMAQNENDRASSWKDLERQVIQLAVAKTGPVQLMRVQPPTEREEAD